MHVVDDSIEITCHEVEIQTEPITIIEEKDEREDSPPPNEIVYHEVQTQTYHNLTLAGEHNQNRSMVIASKDGR